jgi:hypothetical protein
VIGGLNEQTFIHQPMPSFGEHPVNSLRVLSSSGARQFAGLELEVRKGKILRAVLVKDIQQNDAEVLRSKLNEAPAVRYKLGECGHNLSTTSTRRSGR